ncbi:ABC transporter substrate-binding protein [Aquiluna sp.]|nr:ABC transporter substrate-binding protein [Aquiluna sp.]MDA9099594.1 ABC transporter substrate-binding protein [Aquiluna sp.]
MASELTKLRIGQFSESPVLSIARALGLDKEFGVDWVTERVVSSPAQFQALASGEMDIAITSPDNVMLYSTTDANPIKKRLDLALLRPIDRGMGLALFSSDQIKNPGDFAGTKLGVDVPHSGFAFLLLAMLAQLGLDRSSIELESVGATPKRLGAIIEGLVSGSILNAETSIAAKKQGLTQWLTSADISENYLGTVLTEVAGVHSDSTSRFLDLWEEATKSILTLPPEELIGLLANSSPDLASVEYVALVQSSDFGLIKESEVTKDQLLILSEIRSNCGAYSPGEEAISELLSR